MTKMVRVKNVVTSRSLLKRDKRTGVNKLNLCVTSLVNDPPPLYLK